MNSTHMAADMRLAPPTSGSQTSADLIAFAKYCAEHITRDLRGISNWQLFVASSLDGQADAIIRAHVGPHVVEAKASATDPGVAIWEAICHLEQPLREMHARVRVG